MKKNMELLVFSTFSASLLFCIVWHVSLICALLFGLLEFILYGRYKGISWKSLIGLCFHGVAAVKNVIITFLLIGMLTASWRISGTIATIVCLASRFIYPSVFALAAFLLNSAVSFLTGTSFGTSATMGVVCVTIASSMGIDILPVAGAVLGGAYFGDRCSPLSSSMQLVSEITRSSVYDNIRNLAKMAAVPYCVSCIIYLVLGMWTEAPNKSDFDIQSVFAKEFSLHWTTLIPAFLIIVLSLARMRGIHTIFLSIIAAALIAFGVQHKSPLEIGYTMLCGYEASNAEVGVMMNGGGIVSMLNVTAILIISSSYSDLFRKTGLLSSVETGIRSLADKTTSFFAVLCTSIVTAMIACNQSFAVILTNQLSSDLIPDSTERALALSDSAILIAPMIPWSIACAVPLRSINASNLSILFAFYLYLVPLWHIYRSIAAQKKNRVV